MRCVVIDVGNTSTSLAVYADGRVSRFAHVSGGILKHPAACAAAVRRAARGGVCGAVLGSVVPGTNALWRALVRRELGCAPLVVRAGVPMAVAVDYPKPGTIGADRLANAAGGVVKYGAPLIVADFGTALTFDIVTRERGYIGGVIAPGLPLMTDYLHERTALLPHVAPGGACPKIGRSTRGAIQIGARIGYRGMVREIVGYLLQTLGRDVTLVGTGGFARWVLKGIDLPFVIDPHLTVFGLGTIFEQNAGSQ
jgi:type III pantothenate kinase